MIYLMRHGLDDEKYVGGHSDVRLSDQGIIQAIKAGLFIRDNLDIEDGIIASDVRRARETALIVYEINRDKYEHLSFSLSENLRELDKGDLTGKDKSLLTFEEQNILNTKDINQTFPNGESMQDLYERIKNLVDTNWFTEGGDTKQLYVTHRGVINMLYFMFNDEPLSMNKKKFGVEHGTIHEVDFAKKKIKRIY